MLNSPHLPLTPCTGRFTTTKGLPCAHLLQRRLVDHLPLEIEDFDTQWRIDRLGELAELPLIRKITDPLTVKTRFTKSQKRQLSLFEAVQAQIDSLEPVAAKKSVKRLRTQSQIRESLQVGTASQPIDIDEIFDSEDDPLGAELRRLQQPPLSLTTSAIQIKGWIQYQQPTKSIKQAAPPPPSPSRSPLFSPLPDLRTPSPFADLNFTPLPSPSPVPSIASLVRHTSTPPPPTPPKPQTALFVSPMTSPTKIRPKRDAVRPQRYRNG